ncbi:MAG: YicC family protein [Nitrospinae bacterium]|nr:YicC family protein [Nitrospinota bacterium]MZH04274.1 YicC family protein [Nitrospinota bacterium]MZH15343.1 YicC family protein [Nitrospinota bacterium]
MLISMTGFGRAECQKDDYTYQAEVRSVNNRFIEINTRLPKAYMELEQPLKKLIKSYCSRGSINLTISIGNSNENTGEWDVKPNLPLATQYVTALNQIRDTLKLEGEIDLKSIAGIRDIIKIEPLAVDPAKHELIINIATEALTSLQKMREEEGDNLQKDLAQRIDTIENYAAEIESRHPEVIKEYQARLKEKIKNLNEGLDPDETRLAQEVALFADRCDVTEEITRLKSHLNQFRNFFNANEPIGRKLEFITQEINREINTTGSKSSDITISNKVIEIKSELEKIREQVQNIE